MPIVDKKTLKRDVQYHIGMREGQVGRYTLLPGDPARVGRVAKFLEGCEEVAYQREFRTVTGDYHGIRVSCTSTGIGCPSATIAVEELANIGVHTFIRIGSTAALQPHIRLGDLVIAQASMRNEGTSRFYAPPEFPAVADFHVTSALLKAAKALAKERGFVYHFGLVASDDSFYRETPQHIQKLHDLGLISVEMECSAIFVACSQRHGLRGAMISAVAGNLYTGGEEYAEDCEDISRAFDDEIAVALEAIRNLEHNQEGKE